MVPFASAMPLLTSSAWGSEGGLMFADTNGFSIILPESTHLNVAIFSPIVL
jgi:hypothetical protein